jgi:glycosyltransferase involved in cell wall biosynthesis/LmbE family N-acetylglucosaminyl deacetylase
MKLTKMKILFSIYDDLKNPFYAGGGAKAVHEIAKRFARKKDVTVLTGKYPGCQNETIDNVRYKRIGTSILGPKLGQLGFHLALILKIRKTNHDILIETFTPPFSTSFTPLFTKKPVVGLVHMLTSSDMERKYKLPFHLIESFGLKFYKNFIVFSNHDKQKIKKTNPNARVEILSNGIDIPKASKSKRRHIFFIGRIEVNQKGLDLLLKAYKSLPKIPKLIIAGSGSKQEEELLHNQIASLNLQNKVELVGRVSGLKKDKLFREALMCIIPSRYETFGLVALEALSYGVPIICFDIEGLSWLPKDCAVKVSAFDTNKLTKAIAKLINNKKIRNKLSVNGKHLAKKFSWESVFKKYDYFLKETITTPKTSPSLEVPRAGGPNTLTDILGVKSKIPCYFISPHLDDAAFSAGGLISHLCKKKVPVKVINIFTKFGNKPHTLSAKAYVKKCGYKNADDLYQQRVLEDKTVLGKYGIKPINLGFKDALWRKNGKKQKGFSRLIPELVHVYPTYRFHIIKGLISKHDSALVSKIRNSLQSIIQKKALVFCPIGIGNHVDHLITKKVCQSLKRKLIFWSDFPYNLSEEFVNTVGLQTYTLEVNPAKKQKLIKDYRTQIKPMFPNGIPKIDEERYYINIQSIKN